MKKLFALLIVFLMLFALSSTLRVHAVYSTNGRYFDNVVTIVMENEGICEVLSSSISGGCSGGSGPYETSLAMNYSISGACTSDSTCALGGYSGTSHPSEGNYITLVGGYDYGHTGDGYCCWGITGPNIVDRLEGTGLTWK